MPPAWDEAVLESSHPAYACATRSQLAALYPSLPGAHARCYLWATPRAIEDALLTLREWQFRFVDAYLWHYLDSWRVCLVGTRGQPPAPRAPLPRVWIGAGDPEWVVPRRFYTALAQAYPNAQRYALLLPTTPDGWSRP